MTTPPSVFISYARRDAAELAQRLQRRLNEEGLSAWLDTADIPFGSDWSQRIEQAIQESDTAILLLSEASLASPICRSEHLMCLDRRKTIIPILATPQSQRPLYLYSLNYLDLSDGERCEKGFPQLVERIRRGNQDDTVVMPPDTRGPATQQQIMVRWLQNLRNRLQQQVHFFPAYHTDQYVPRAHERVFQDFLASPKPVLSFPGASGMGKSVLLHRLADTYSGSCILFYARDLTPTVEALGQATARALADDLKPDLLLQAVESMPISPRQPLVMFVDALNQHPAPAELLTALTQFLLQFRQMPIKLVITCQTQVWQTLWQRLRLEQSLASALFYGLEGASEVLRGWSEPLVVGPYTDEELATLYTRLKLLPAWNVIERHPQVKEWLRDPLMLWIASEVYGQSGTGSIPLQSPSRDIMARYVQQIGQQTGDPRAAEAVLLNLVGRMAEQRCLTLPLAELDAYQGSVERLIEQGVLETTHDSGGSAVRFTQTRLFEYLLYRHLASQPRRSLDSQAVQGLLAESDAFAPLWGALQYWMGIEWPTGLLSELAQEDDSAVHNFLVALCQVRLVEAPGDVSDFLQENFTRGGLGQKRFAVAAAFACEQIPLLEEALVDPDEKIQLLAAEYLEYIYDTSVDDAYMVLESLSRRIPKGLLGVVRNLDYVNALIYLSVLLGPRFLSDPADAQRFVGVWRQIGQQVIPRMIYLKTDGKLVRQLARNLIAGIVKQAVMAAMGRNEGGWIDGVALKEFFEMPLSRRERLCGLSPYADGTPLDAAGADLLFELAQIDNGMFFSVVRATLAVQAQVNWEATEALLMRLFEEGGPIGRGCAVAGLGVYMLRRQPPDEAHLYLYISLIRTYLDSPPYGQMVFNGRPKPGWVIYYLGVAVYRFQQQQPDAAFLLYEHVRQVLWEAQDPDYLDDVADELALLVVDTDPYFTTKLLRDLYDEPRRPDSVRRVILRALSQISLKYPAVVEAFSQGAGSSGETTAAFQHALRQQEHGIYALNLVSSRFEHFFAEVIYTYPQVRQQLFTRLVSAYPRADSYGDAVGQMIDDVIALLETTLNA